MGVIVLRVPRWRSDGVVTDDEVNAFRRCLDTAGEMKNVPTLGEEDVTGYEVYAEQLARCSRAIARPRLLEGLFHIATCSCPPTTSTLGFLRLQETSFPASV